MTGGRKIHGAQNETKQAKKAKATDQKALQHLIEWSLYKVLYKETKRIIGKKTQGHCDKGYTKASAKNDKIEVMIFTNHFFPNPARDKKQ